MDLTSICGLYELRTLSELPLSYTFSMTAEWTGVSNAEIHFA